jgi:hypothetical protein
MKSSHTATIIFMIFCFSTIQSLLVKQPRKCTLREDLGKPKPKPTPPAAPTKIDGKCKPNQEGFTEGVRFVRLKGPHKQFNFLQISQVVVFDTKGNNVALKKPAFCSSRHPGSTGPNNQVVDPNWAVDGLINNRWGWPNDKVTIIDYYPKDPDPWWMVDLQADFDIKQIKYYNRSGWTDRAIGVEIQLLDSDKNVIKSYVTTNDIQIYCVNTI